MSVTSLKSNFYYIVPYGVALAVYLIASVVESAITKYQLIFNYIPYLLLAFVALLSLHFNRGRVLLAAVVLATTCWGMQSSSLRSNQAQLVVLLAAFVPANLLLISIIRERGVFTLLNYLLVIIFGMEAMAALWLCHHLDYPFWHYLRSDLIAIERIPGIKLTQPGMACILVAALLLSFIWYLRRSPLNNALLAILLAVSLLLNSYDSLGMCILMFSSAGVILLVSLLQDSYHMAYRDELTGLMGRRALNERLQKLGHRYVIAMLDVDRFKKFNDTYGHDVGDQVLKMVATHLTKATGGCRPYRYGGEEFALVFPRKKIPQVKPHLEALRESIADYEMSIRSAQRPKEKKEGMKRRSQKTQKTRAKVTVSIGVAQRNDVLRSPELVIKAADEKLYEAKRKGRNKVICG